MSTRALHSAATPSLPTHLPPRYEIRRLTLHESPWIAAIVIHSNLFHSSVFPVVYPDNKTARAYRGMTHANYLIEHQIKSGHSFGVFDTQYQYRTKEAEAIGGKLLWDYSDESASQEKLLEQMDFPLVSVAMAYDGINALDMQQIKPLIGVLPVFGDVYHHLEELDSRNPDSWKPTGPKQVLLRNATSTRREYEGKGLMRKLAEWLMRYAAEEGFRGIQIECLADRVTQVWSQPPTPFKGQVVCEFNTWEYVVEQEVDGVKQDVKPFGEARQRVTKVYTELKPYGGETMANGHKPTPMGVSSA